MAVVFEVKGSCSELPYESVLLGVMNPQLFKHLWGAVVVITNEQVSTLSPVC